MECADSISEVHQKLHWECLRLGFERFAYQLIRDRGGSPAMLFTNTFGEKWTAYFAGNRWINHEAVTLHFPHELKPFMWHRFYESVELTRLQKQIAGDATDAGMSSGCSVPLHGPGEVKAVLSFTADIHPDKFTKLFEERMPELWAIALNAHDAMVRIGLGPQITTAVNLTEIEVSIMKWTIEGKSSSAIAEILNLPETTINYHLKSICKKYDVSTKLGAVAKVTREYKNFF